MIARSRPGCWNLPGGGIAPLCTPARPASQADDSHPAKKGSGRQDHGAHPWSSGFHRVHNPSAAVGSAMVALLIPPARNGIVPLGIPGRQWTQCSLRLPVGTVPILIADGRDASPADMCVTVTHSSPRPTAPWHSSHAVRSLSGRQPRPAAKNGLVPLPTLGRQWTQCSLRLPVGTAHFDY